MRPLIDHVQKHEEISKERERIYQEYVDGGPYSMLELVEIRKEIENQIHYFTDIAHRSIERIVPFKIYFGSETLKKERDEIVKEFREYFDENEDLFRIEEWFLDHSCKVLQERFYNRFTEKQIEEVRFTLSGLVTFSETIFDFEIRKQVLNRYIKNVLRNKVKRDDKPKPKPIPDWKSILNRMKELVDEGYSDNKAAKMVEEEFGKIRAAKTIKNHFRNYH